MMVQDEETISIYEDSESVILACSYSCIYKATIKSHWGPPLLEQLHSIR